MTLTEFKINQMDLTMKVVKFLGALGGNNIHILK